MLAETTQFTNLLGQVGGCAPAECKVQHLASTIPVSNLAIAWPYDACLTIAWHSQIDVFRLQILRVIFFYPRRFGQPHSWPAAKPIKKNKKSVDISMIRYAFNVTWQLKHCGGTCNAIQSGGWHSCLSVLGAHDLSFILQIQLGHTTKLFPVHHASCFLCYTFFYTVFRCFSSDNARVLSVDTSSEYK